MKKKLLEVLYWCLSCTWGIIMTLVGVVVLPISLMLGGKLRRNGFGIIVEIGGNRGGVSLGPIALCGNYSSTSESWFEHTRKHEFGHSLQNCVFGPFFIFLVAIPSACRYWYQNIQLKRGKKFDSTWYDSIWFEGTATSFGTKFIDKIED